MSPAFMRKIAKPMLFAVALVWGTSFFIMKNTVDAVPVLWVLFFRFATAAVLLSLFCWKKWKLHFTRDYIWRGSTLGVLLFLAYAAQNFGLLGTTPSKNAFLTAVYCVLVPFLHWACTKVAPDRYHLAAAFLCITGVGLVSLSGDLSITWGDLLTLLSALFFGMHIVGVNQLSVSKDIYLLTVFQFATVALLSLVFGLLSQPFPSQIFFDPAVLWPLAYLCVPATTVALVCQNVGQVWSDSSSAAVILSLESVFGVLFSVLFYGDPITIRLLVGFTLIFLAVLCSETKFSFLHPSKAAPPVPTADEE